MLQEMPVMSSGGGGGINPTIVSTGYSSTFPTTVTTTLDSSKNYLLIMANSSAIAEGSNSGTDVYLIQNNTLSEIQKITGSVYTPSISGNTLTITVTSARHTGYNLIQLN